MTSFYPPHLTSERPVSAWAIMARLADSLATPGGEELPKQP